MDGGSTVSMPSDRRKVSNKRCGRGRPGSGDGTGGGVRGIDVTYVTRTVPHSTARPGQEQDYVPSRAERSAATRRHAGRQHPGSQAGGKGGKQSPRPTSGAFWLGPHQLEPEPDVPLPEGRRGWIGTAPRDARSAMLGAKRVWRIPRVRITNGMIDGLKQPRRGG